MADLPLPERPIVRNLVTNHLVVTRDGLDGAAWRARVVSQLLALAIVTAIVLKGTDDDEDAWRFFHHELAAMRDGGLDAIFAKFGDA